MLQNRQIFNTEQLQALFDQLQLEQPELDLDRIRQDQAANRTFLEEQYQQIILEDNDRNGENDSFYQNEEMNDFSFFSTLDNPPSYNQLSQMFPQNRNPFFNNHYNIINNFQTQIKPKKKNKFSIATKMYRQKKYQKCLDILFQIKKHNKTLFVLEKIAACFYQLDDFTNTIIFAKKLQKQFNREDKCQKILGCVYGKRAIHQRKICLAKKSIFYFCQVFKKHKSVLNQKNFEKIKFVRYYLALEKKREAKIELKNYLKKFNLKFNSSKFYKSLKFKKKIPYYIKCGISMDIMNQPFLSPSGITFERSFLIKAFQGKQKTADPFTRQIISKIDCLFNKTLQNLIIDFKNQYPYFVIEGCDTKTFELSNIDFTL